MANICRELSVKVIWEKKKRLSLLREHSNTGSGQALIQQLHGSGKSIAVVQDNHYVNILILITDPDLRSNMQKHSPCLSIVSLFLSNVMGSLNWHKATVQGI